MNKNPTLLSHEILMEKEKLTSLGELIGSITHNLMTPLMSLHGGLDVIGHLVNEKVLTDSGNPPQTRDERSSLTSHEINVWIENLKAQCKYMSDILSTVKSQVVKSSYQTDNTFTIQELIHRVSILMNTHVKLHHCKLRIISHIEQETYISGEISGLIQVTSNLISNAIQAYDTKGGIIEVQIKLDQNELLLSVSDKGMGISDSIKDRIFKEMVTTKGTAGSGIGLYMAHAYIKEHFKGNLHFESEEGQGSQFVISIPKSTTHTSCSQCIYGNI